MTKAILAGENYAFGTVFDFLYLLQHDLRLILGGNVQIRMFIDSKLLSDLVTKTSYTAYKRLMIYITCIRDHFKLGDIDEVGHTLSEHNPADSFTKLRRKFHRTYALEGDWNTQRKFS